MPWSAFDQPNGDQLAVDFMTDVYGLLHVTPSLDMLTFGYQWCRSEGGGGQWNLTNCGPLTAAEDYEWGLPFPIVSLTGEQFGGGAADYASRDDGVKATADYLSMPNYTSVLAAMRRGDPAGAMHALWASPWASGHYGYGAGWNHSPLPTPPPAPVKPWPWATNVVQVHGHAQTWAHRLTGGHGDAKAQIPPGKLAVELAHQKTAGKPAQITWLMDLQHNLDQLTALPTVAWS